MRTENTIHLALANAPFEQRRSLEDYFPMVHRVVRNIHRRLPKNVEIEELYSEGLVGLWDAYAKFNPGKNVRFTTYAQFRVRGAILDGLRTLDWAPRGLRINGRAVQEAIRKLIAQQGRTPSEDEVAAELKVNLQTYQRLLGDLHGLELDSLNRAPFEDSEEEIQASIPGRREDDPLFLFLQGEVMGQLAGAVESLSDQERLVVTLSYYEELTLREIGLTLGKSETRIQQIRASAVSHLRSILSKSSQKGLKNLQLIHCRGFKKTSNPVPLKSAA